MTTDPQLTPLGEAIAHTIAAHEQGGTWVPGQEVRRWHKRAAADLEAALCDTWRASRPTRRLVQRLEQMTPPEPTPRRYANPIVARRVTIWSDGRLKSVWHAGNMWYFGPTGDEW